MIDWRKVYGLESSEEELREINLRLERHRKENPRAAYEKKFKPGHVEKMKDLEDLEQFRPRSIEGDENHYGKVLQAYKMTGYVEQARDDSSHERYALNPGRRRISEDFSKYRMAQNTVDILHGLDVENVFNDLNRYEGSILDNSASINGEEVIDAYRNIEYTEDLQSLLTGLGLVTEDNAVNAMPEDFKTVRKAVETVYQN